jgi:hypothetical protein
MLILGGCAGAYRAPDPDALPTIDTGSLRQRALAKSEGGLEVRVAALNASESEALFGLPLGSDDIQPVWIEVENGDDQTYLFFPIDLDPDYYAPFELAWKYRHQGTGLSLNDLGLLFTREHIPLWIPAGGRVAGFVFTRRDQGAKAIAVDLMGEHTLKRFDFVVEVPGLRADYLRVDWDGLYDPSEIRDLDEEQLRQALDALPCCALGGDKKTPGDPLNLVVIAPPGEALAPFIRQGWDLTETVHTASVWRTVASSVFGSYYRYSPVSNLHVFGRPQDVALQKARRTVDERNHLRLWITPYRFAGHDVWVGQISRDIGVRLTAKTLVTHKIDPDVDESREYLIQDLVRSQYVARLGYVRGVGPAGTRAPRFNYTGDPYWTDGLRAALQLSQEPVPVSAIELFSWEWPKVTTEGDGRGR